MFSRENIEIDIHHSVSCVQIKANATFSCNTSIPRYDVTSESVDRQVEILKGLVMTAIYGNLRSELAEIHRMVNELSALHEISSRALEDICNLRIFIADVIGNTR